LLGEVVEARWWFLAAVRSLLGAGWAGVEELARPGA
jgi:hypothetical protein